MWKKIVAGILTAGGVLGAFGAYHGITSAFETKAHASEAREQITDDLAAVNKVLLRIQKQQIRKDMAELEDKYDTTDPLDMEQPDRDRYRELKEELEWIESELGGNS